MAPITPITREKIALRHFFKGYLPSLGLGNLDSLTFVKQYSEWRIETEKARFAGYFVRKMHIFVLHIFPKNTVQEDEHIRHYEDLIFTVHDLPIGPILRPLNLQIKKSDFSDEQTEITEFQIFPLGDNNPNSYPYWIDKSGKEIPLDDSIPIDLIFKSAVLDLGTYFKRSSSSD